MYFDVSGNTIECLITGRQWKLPTAGTAGYVVEKKRLIESVKDYQRRMLDKIFKLPGPRGTLIDPHFFTLADLQAGAAKLA
jgi:hypothetical protein